MTTVSLLSSLLRRNHSTMSFEKDTPNIPSSSAVFYIQSSTHIDAPIQDVWQALTDTSTWPRWNRFVPRVTVREQPTSETIDYTVLRAGTRFNFHVNMYPESDPSPQPQKRDLRATNLQVIHCEPPPSPSSPSNNASKKAKIVWASDAAADGLIMSSLLTAERVHELEEVEVDGKTMTAVHNWEAQVGLLAYLVKWLFGARLRSNFGIWESGLRGFVEGA